MSTVVKKATKNISVKSTSIAKKVVKKDSGYLVIFSRHPSHNVLRRKVKVPVPCSIRFGSKTLSKRKDYVVLNTPEAIATSSDKLLMKIAFRKEEVKTAPWTPNPTGYTIAKEENKTFLVIGDKKLKFPIVTKHRFGSRGSGNILHETTESFERWFKSKTEDSIMDYIVEQYTNYDKEYRLHVTADGCFYTCRKALKQNIDPKDKWFRNDSNSVWFMEDNEEEFKKPSCWEAIVAESIKALNAVGLDVGAVDLRCQNELTSDGKQRKEVDFFVVEINSAPSFGEVTAAKYAEELPRIINAMLAV